MLPTKEDLQKAHKSIKPYIHKTPVMTSQTINDLTGAEVFFKCENFQKMGAFKMRGGTYAVQCLTEEQKAKGVATHSSGNFAQAVALAAQIFGIKAYIIMPSNAPSVKKAAVKGYGAQVIECEPTLKAREAATEKIIEKTGASYLHPYNQIPVILGQGTACMELLEEIENLDYVFAPIGGGGLCAGTALAAHYFSDHTKVIGCEPFGADDAYLSLKKGQIVPQDNPNTIADGLRTSLGDIAFPILQNYIEEIIRVTEQEIIDALRLHWERMKIVTEPSCAVPLAALVQRKEDFRGKRIGIIISGGNVDIGLVARYFTQGLSG